MSSIDSDSRIVMTLDAGGTNFIFSAIQGGHQIIKPIRRSPNSHILNKCLNTILEGFEAVKKKLNEPPAAISFAFPGPADYPKGIIGDLQNLPSFRGGVALGPMLEAHFKIPVYINNDGNLFAYGEALFGILPEINYKLEATKSPKRFHNLIGITLGTGFGVGLVCNNQLITGDNSNGGEGWLLRNILNPKHHVEKHLSREGIRNTYAEKSGTPINSIGAPFDVYNIAKGLKKGHQKAAISTFSDYGTVLGEALANIITLIDGIVVIGGGVSGAFDLFATAMFEQLDSHFLLNDGSLIHRIVPKIFNLEDPIAYNRLLEGQKQELKIPNSTKTVMYDPFLRTGIGVSKNGTSKIIGLGAYAFAINQLNESLVLNQ